MSALIASLYCNYITRVKSKFRWFLQTSLLDALIGVFIVILLVLRASKIRYNVIILVKEAGYLASVAFFECKTFSLFTSTTSVAGCDAIEEQIFVAVKNAAIINETIFLIK